MERPCDACHNVLEVDRSAVAAGEGRRGRSHEEGDCLARGDAAFAPDAGEGKHGPFHARWDWNESVHK
jgi:hypothetical protein